jgi:2-dehydro-3-deoxyphosphogalactonate aldolase
LNQPIYNLLGGQCHEKLRAYAYMPTEGIWEDPERAGKIAAELLEEGNTAMKFDPFPPLFPQPRDIPLQEINYVAKIFASIRDAVGDKMEVGIGTHGQLTTSSAIRIASILEEYHPFWFEEPVAPENVDEMARVAAHTNIPIATGSSNQNGWYSSRILAILMALEVVNCPCVPIPTSILSPTASRMLAKILAT